MIKAHATLVNESNSRRIKDYYQLNELVSKTGLCIRTLKYRMLEIKEKYKDVDVLLSKVGKRWQIHYTIINDFLPKKAIKNSTVYNFDWKSFATWNTKNSYDSKYHLQIIGEVKERLGDVRVLYSIEQDKRGVNHVHLVAECDKTSLNRAINYVINRYLNVEEYRSDISTIINKYSTIHYLYKDPLTSGII